MKRDRPAARNMHRARSDAEHDAEAADPATPGARPLETLHQSVGNQAVRQLHENATAWGGL